MERYGVFLRIQCEYGKIRTRITPNMELFYAVIIASLFRLTNINSQVIKHSKKKNDYEFEKS